MVTTKLGGVRSIDLGISTSPVVLQKCKVQRTNEKQRKAPQKLKRKKGELKKK
jgi:hypothetical protein